MPEEFARLSAAPAYNRVANLEDTYPPSAGELSKIRAKKLFDDQLERVKTSKQEVYWHSTCLPECTMSVSASSFAK